MDVDTLLRKIKRLLAQNKKYRAFGVIRRFSSGREDPIAEKLLEIGFTHHPAKEPGIALSYFDLSRKIAKNNELRKIATENAIIAHNNFGSLLQNNNQHKDAEKEYKEALGMNPDYSVAHYNYGNLLQKLGRHDEAEKEYRKAIEIDPDYANAHYNLGILLKNLNYNDEAEKEYRETIRINPNRIDAHNNLGNLLSELKRYEEAEREYKEVLRIDFRDAKAHYNLGSLLKDLNRKEEAEKEYRKAIEMDPNYAKAYNNYGNLLSELKRYEEAEEEYKIAIEIDSEYVLAHNNYGNFLSELKRYGEAEKEYRRAIEIDSSYAELHANYGFLLFSGLNHYDKATYEFGMASRLFLEEKRNFYSKMLYGYQLWAEARMAWENQNLGEAKSHYLKASTNFAELKIMQLSNFLQKMSALIYISKEYLNALDSNTLLELKSKLNKQYKKFLDVCNKIKNIDFPDFDLINAQFIVIQLLNKTLNFESVEPQKLDEARSIFRNYNFNEPFQATNSLDNFIEEINKFKSLRDISEIEEKRLLRMIQPFNVFDSLITKRLENKSFERHFEPYKKIMDKLETLEKGQTEIISHTDKGISAIRGDISELKKDIKLISSQIDNLQNPKEYLDEIIEISKQMKKGLSKISQKHEALKEIEEKIDKILYNVEQPLETQAKLKTTIQFVGGILPVVSFGVETGTDIPRAIVNGIEKFKKLMGRMKNELNL